MYYLFIYFNFDCLERENKIYARYTFKRNLHVEINWKQQPPLILLRNFIPKKKESQKNESQY